MTKSEEMKRHDRLVREIFELFKISGFITDRHIHIKIPKRPKAIECDVVAIHSNAILIIECKTPKKASNINWEHESSRWKDVRNDIKENFEEIEIEKSAEHIIDKKFLSKIKYPSIKIIFALKIPKYSEDSKNWMKKRGIEYLDKEDIFIYKETAKIIQELNRYHILRDFDIETSESTTPIEIKAFEIKQPGRTFYFFKLPPSELLKICYVHRRKKKETYGYQRYLNGNRIEEIGTFIGESGKKHSILPNNIIIAWDNDIKIKYSPETNDIKIPGKYCSAFVVDGQHRLYGFKNTIYGKAKIRKKHYNDFNLLVVGIEEMSLLDQAKTFIDINYRQEKINMILLCDLSTLIGNLKDKITWPSYLAKKLSTDNRSVLKDKIKINQYQRGHQPITIHGLGLTTLLKYSLKLEKNGTYTGPLYNYSPFDPTKDFKSEINKKAFNDQYELLLDFFSAVKKWTSFGRGKYNQWDNYKDYIITGYKGINSLLFVLNKILELDIKKEDFKEFLEPIKNVRGLTYKTTKELTGWAGLKTIANRFIDEINKAHSSGKFKKIKLKNV